MKKTQMIVVLIGIGVLYYFYKKSNAPSLGTKQCCDINYNNYNEACITNTDCVCDQSICANTGAASKVTFNT